LIIPLARIVPRLLRRKGLSQNLPASSENPRRNFFQENPQDNFQESTRREEFSTKNWSKDKIVLGLLMTDITKFEEIQKRANLSTNNLDTILQDLENKGLMTPVEKSGPFGKSIQLKITEKGAAEFRRM